MSHRHHHDWNEAAGSAAREAWLGSYLDGELGPEERARVEAWLAEDPDARVELESLRDLRDLFDEGGVDPPGPHAWGATLDHIEAGLRSAPPRRKRGGWDAAGWLTAAAILTGVVWLGSLAPPRTDNPRPIEPDVDVLELVAENGVVIEDMDPLDSRYLIRGRVPMNLPAELWTGTPLEVTGADEVAVVSMDGNDTDALVVCEPPVAGPLLVVRRGQVRVDRIGTLGSDDPKPWLNDRGSGMPMLMLNPKGLRRD